MTVQDLKDQKLIIFETISGSKAFGTDTPTSDTDIRGVFVLPLESFYGINTYISEVKDERGDIKYYELNKFIEFAYENKPDVIEMLFSPEDCILYKHQLWNLIDPHKFLTKKCGPAFSGFARNQIRKARGLKKAINNPQPKKRKSPLDFCHILVNGLESKKLLNVYNKKQLKNAGISHTSNGNGVYGLFLDPDNKFNFKGVVNKEETSNGLRLSSIPKEWYEYYKCEAPIILVYNQNGYKTHCKDHKNYWDWVYNRNEDRYQTNIEHGKDYDSKNLLHTMRGVNMAIEIGEGKGVIVRRPDREELMKIRNGQRNFDEIMIEVESKLEKIDSLFKTCDLPETVDIKYVNKLAYNIRHKFYDKLKKKAHDL